jgi:RNA polymerase sigma factor (sigma-70 family)
MMDDLNLVRAFNEARSEDAFAELVGRHVDFVYRTALRVLDGDVHAAKDVSQSVFIDLASKASTLDKRPSLTGWLHTSTVYAARKAIRSARRRHAREQEALMMQEQSQTDGPEIEWERLQPDLDALLLELKEPDREALLLRYFRQCSFAELGRKLGVTDNAARMRVERALDKLRDGVVRRGMTSSVSALAVLLARQSVGLAPDGLAASVVASSMAVVATATGPTTVVAAVMSHAKPIAAGMLIAAGIVAPALIQHRQNARLTEQNDALRLQLLEQASGPALDATASESDELVRMHLENAELRPLREQVRNLRAALARGSQKHIGPHEVEDDQSPKPEPAEGSPNTLLLRKSPEIPMLPAHAWSNQGFETPLSAIQTLHWAILNHDAKAFATAMHWDSQIMSQAASLFADLPQPVQLRQRSVEDMILDWTVGQSKPIESYRVLSQTDLGPNAVTLFEQCQSVDGLVREASILLHKDENGNWRRMMAAEEMPKLEAMIRRLATQPGSEAHSIGHKSLEASSLESSKKR